MKTFRVREAELGPKYLFSMTFKVQKPFGLENTHQPSAMSLSKSSSFHLYTESIYDTLEFRCCFSVQANADASKYLK